jgi:hypothetical protein
MWYWRIMPPKKGGGVLVKAGEHSWSVSANPGRIVQKRMLQIAERPIPYPLVPRARALNAWLADIPELNDRERARAWLAEIWKSESECDTSVVGHSFVEQELGRLLLRDDGWLDEGELMYLRIQVRGNVDPSLPWVDEVSG